jgi:hypothetical protein
LDELLLNFIKEVDSLNRNEGSFSIDISSKERVPLKTLIADFQLYVTASLKWVDVFNCLTINLKRSRQTNESISRFVSQVEHCSYPDLLCLGCSKFFYYNYTNLASNPSRQIPIKVFPLVEKLSEYETQVL